MKLPFALGALLLVAMQAKAQTAGEQRCLSTCLDSAVYRPGLRTMFGSKKVGQIISNDGQVETASKPESTIELTPPRLTLSIFF